MADSVFVVEIRSAVDTLSVFLFEASWENLGEASISFEVQPRDTAFTGSVIGKFGAAGFVLRRGIAAESMGLLVAILADFAFSVSIVNGATLDVATWDTLGTDLDGSFSAIGFVGASHCGAQYCEDQYEGEGSSISKLRHSDISKYYTRFEYSMLFKIASNFWH